MAGGWEPCQIKAAAACLEARLFIVVDEGTEECLVRSFVRFDGLLKQPRMAVSFANAYAEVASNDLRGVIVHEAKKLHALDPELAGWGKPQATALLGFPSVDPRSRPLPEDPFAHGFTQGFAPGFGDGFAPGLGETLPRVSTSPTTATATATSRQSPRGSSSKRGTRLPDDFVVTDEMRTWVEEKYPGLDWRHHTEAFRDYWVGAPGAKGVKQAWVPTWRNWMRREYERSPMAQRQGRDEEW